MVRTSKSSIQYVTVGGAHIIIIIIIIISVMVNMSHIEISAKQISLLVYFIGYDFPNLI
jgi:hypothetical protein